LLAVDAPAAEEDDEDVLVVVLVEDDEPLSDPIEDELSFGALRLSVR
jgi:hypothetical protein